MKIINKKLIITVVIIFVIGIVGFGLLVYVRQNNTSLSSENEGYGPRIDSPLIKSAIKEKKNLIPFLPFDKKSMLSTGVEVSIVVPSEKYQHNAWTTTIQIFGIDYDISVDDDPDYERTKESFLEASRIVFDWMKSHGVDHNQMIINWGDKAFIQERAEQWLGE